jgi:hypothetical protein
MTVSVGMDVHRKRSQVAVVDDAGIQQRNRNVPNHPTKLVPILGALPPGTPVAFEAAYGPSVARRSPRPAQERQVLDQPDSVLACLGGHSRGHCFVCRRLGLRRGRWPLATTPATEPANMT